MFKKPAVLPSRPGRALSWRVIITTMVNALRRQLLTARNTRSRGVATVNMTRDTGYLVPRSDVTNFWGPRDMQLGIKFLW